MCTCLDRNPQRKRKPAVTQPQAGGQGPKRLSYMHIEYTLMCVCVCGNGIPVYVLYVCVCAFYTMNYAVYSTCMFDYCMINQNCINLCVCPCIMCL